MHGSEPGLVVVDVAAKQPEAITSEAELHALDRTLVVVAYIEV
ncbi:hypothetical protein ACIGO6_38845 [Streptomyces sp. NPDC053750]